MTELLERTEQAFVLKGSIFTFTVLQLMDAASDKINQQLDELVVQAPKFFQNAPVVIDLQRLQKNTDDLELAGLKAALQQRGMIPVGLRGGTPNQHDAAKGEGLAILSIAKSETPTLTQGKPGSRKKDKDETTAASKIVTKPVRSGQQVYARGGDLVVTATVSPGAELLADGHIHVYGPLRGRALAGIGGDTDARIFCQGLDAELVSIAGRYIVNEALIANASTQATQVYLEDGGLQIETL
jgi:septum site-determining protein MinC